jgi:hypothetical protein
MFFLFCPLNLKKVQNIMLPQSITVKYVEVGNHEEKNCPAENETKCINCSKYNTKSGGQNTKRKTNHSADNKEEYETYKLTLQRVI